MLCLYRGVKRFYTHQAEAINAIFNGLSIVVAMPIASNKIMAYLIPICSFDEDIFDLISLSNLNSF